MDTRKSGFGMKLVKVIVIALVFGLVAGGTFAGVNFAYSKFFPSTTTETSGYKGTAVEGTAVSTATTVKDVSDIVSNVMPSVVSVTNISLTQYRTLYGTGVQETPSAGTGVIFNQDNEKVYIVTNNHVVENSNSLTVTFSNGTAVDAAIVGASQTDDIAVISAKLSDIDEATRSTIKVSVIGDSNELVPGDGSIIIGNALGYGQSVTTGVISALNRKINAQDNYGRNITNTVIQTDAAVNPGNSGGPLLNMKGEMVGIVSAKFSDTTVEGMGYAIPSSTVAAIINEIMNNKTANSSENANTNGGAYLGIAGMDISQSIARQYNIPIGVYVTKVYTGAAAEKANISQGDVITAIDGTQVTSMSQVKNILTTKKSGDKITITVAKADSNYKSAKVEVTL